MNRLVDLVHRERPGLERVADAHAVGNPRLRHEGMYPSQGINPVTTSLRLTLPRRRLRLDAGMEPLAELLVEASLPHGGVAGTGAGQLLRVSKR